MDGAASILAMWAYEDWLEQAQLDAEQEADHYFTVNFSRGL